MRTKDDSQAAPEVFNVPVRDEPEPEHATDKPSGSRTTGVKSNGVPPARLAAVSLPVLAVVAGAAMWAVSPLLAVGVFGGTVAAGGAAYMAHKARRRRSGQSRGAGSVPRMVSGHTGTAGGTRRRRSVLGGLSGRRRGAGSASGGSRSTGTGARRGLLSRGRRGAGRATGVGRSAASGSTGHGRTQGQSRMGRLFGRRGRNSSGSTGTGRSRGRTATGATTGTGSRGLGRLFGRRNPGGTGTGATPSRSRGQGLLGRKSPAGGKGRGRGLLGSTTGGSTSTPGAKTPKRPSKRRQGAAQDDRGGWSRGRDGSKGRDRSRGGSGGGKDDTATGGKVVKTTKDKDAKDKAGEQFPIKPKTRSGMKSELLVDDGGFPSPGKRRVKAAPGPAVPVDDAGFPSPTVRKPSETKPAPKPAEKAAPKPDEQYDEEGFPLVPIASVTPIKAGGGKSGNERKLKVSAPTTGEVRSGYAQMIDNSTVALRVKTLNEAADAARRDAQTLQEKANQRYAEAAGLDDKPGMSETAERFRREAADLEDDARSRLGMAGAYEEAAGNEAKASA